MGDAVWMQSRQAVLQIPAKAYPASGRHNLGKLGSTKPVSAELRRPACNTNSGENLSCFRSVQARSLGNTKKIHATNTIEAPMLRAKLVVYRLVDDDLEMVFVALDYRGHGPNQFDVNELPADLDFLAVEYRQLLFVTAIGNM